MNRCLWWWLLKHWLNYHVAWGNLSNNLLETYWPLQPAVTFCYALLQPKLVQFWLSDPFPSFLKKFGEENQQQQTRFWWELGFCSSLSIQADLQSLNCSFLWLNEGVIVNLQQLYSARCWPSGVLRRVLLEAYWAQCNRSHAWAWAQL